MKDSVARVIGEQIDENLILPSGEIIVEPSSIELLQLIILRDTVMSLVRLTLSSSNTISEEN